MQKPSRFAVVLGTAMVMVSLGVIHVLNRIGDNIHADAVVAPARICAVPSPQLASGA